MPVRISDRQQLHRTLDGLADDIHDAGVHLRLYLDLRGAIAEFEREFNQSPAFWTLTFAGPIDAVHTRLTRAYDNNSQVLSLPRFMEWVVANGLPTPTRIDTGTLANDHEWVSSQNPLVAKLLALRGNVLAHRNATNVIEIRNFEERFGLTVAELQQLTDRGREILNRYAQELAGTTWAEQMIGHGDYLALLRAVKASCDEHERRIEREIAAATNGGPT